MPVANEGLGFQSPTVNVRMLVTGDCFWVGGRSNWYNTTPWNKQFAPKSHGCHGDWERSLSCLNKRPIFRGVLLLFYGGHKPQRKQQHWFIDLFFGKLINLFLAVYFSPQKKPRISNFTNMIKKPLDFARKNWSKDLGILLQGWFSKPVSSLEFVPICQGFVWWAIASRMKMVCQIISPWIRVEIKKWVETCWNHHHHKMEFLEEFMFPFQWDMLADHFSRWDNYLRTKINLHNLQQVWYDRVCLSL